MDECCKCGCDTGKLYFQSGYLYCYHCWIECMPFDPEPKTVTTQEEWDSMEAYGYQYSPEAQVY